ncbi:sensor histidine kinase [Runella slithyformis]|uniref:Signal transduction histidine kinase n=1 Tax=Runella slithyformis (strain ATCC 29530 / DSM 19594 / LMG 11500 / NCIMB 11436 / LSU 4) TaxID=761193 RepID=A0A7U3ZH63_RUNSL|nr:histidine kinase [Runella slithyformis]AEI47147.1 putative signal transduction histidine kinase [Runella slithyformis DSM 19594]
MLLRPNKKNITLVIHLLAWGLLAALVLMPPFGGRFTMPDEYWAKQWILLGLLAATFYLNAKVLLPRLLFKNHSLWYVISITASVAFIYWTIQGVESWLNLPELWHKATRPDRPFNPNRAHRFDMFTFLYSLLSLGVSTSLTVVQKWQKDAQIREQLEREKVVSELSFLKAQINPHFFFNTLNNIYALTMMDVASAQEALHRLSRMMRYVLYETKEGTVRLSQEIAFLEDYIQLMQLRLTDKVKVTFEKPATHQDVAIAPMLLLPFLENAFKHGVSATRSSEIFIGLTQSDQTLRVEVRNTLFTEKRVNLDESNGIGLVNTRRRLDLLYPGHYSLNITEHTPNDEYLVELTLHTAPLKPQTSTLSPAHYDA